MMIEYIGYIFAALTLIGNVVYNFYYKNKKEKEIQILQHEYDSKKNLIEKRFSVYREYLSKSDAINNSAFIRQYNEEVQNDIQELLHGMIEDPYNIEMLKKHQQFMADQSQVLFKWMEETNMLLETTNAVKLVCSVKVRELLDEYVKLTKEQMQAQAGLLFGSMLVEGTLMPTIAKDIIENSKKIKLLCEIKHDLETAMREDIGNI